MTVPGKSPTFSVTTKAKGHLPDGTWPGTMYFNSLLAVTCSHLQPLEWPQVAAEGKWPQVAAEGKWPQVAVSGRRGQVAASGRKRPQKASGRKWPQVAAKGKWPQVAASGRFSQNQFLLHLHALCNVWKKWKKNLGLRFFAGLWGAFMK